MPKAYCSGLIPSRLEELVRSLKCRPSGAKPILAKGWRVLTPRKYLGLNMKLHISAHCEGFRATLILCLL